MTNKKPQNFAPFLSLLQGTQPLSLEGRVTKVVGLVIEGDGPAAAVGEICQIYPNNDMPPVEAEVVGFREGIIQLMPVGIMSGLTPGNRIVATGRPAMVEVGPQLLGRVLDGLGRLIDGKGPIEVEGRYPVQARPGNPLERDRITKPLDVGLKAINGLLTVGQGQRVGIFAGSGVGKSTLLGMMARQMETEVNVIAMIGERGREVLDFIEKDLGPEGMARSVIVAATSEQPALVRMRGAYVGTAIAEYFRDLGYNVVLMMDSATRYAFAAREVGLSIGEPATTRGYTPSVFAQLPLLLERAGAWPHGSITGLYTVLVDGDDMNEPVADAMRSILDGHIVLRRDLAAKNHYPAIDVLSSISRLMTELVDREQLTAAGRFKDVLAVYSKNEDMINLGAYQRGANPEIDRAIELYPSFMNFLKQPFSEGISLAQSREMLLRLTSSVSENPGGGGGGAPGRRR